MQGHLSLSHSSPHSRKRWSFHSSDSQGFSYTLTLQLPMQRMGLPFAMCPPCVAMGKHAKKVLKYVLFTFRPIRLHFVVQLHVFSETMNGVEWIIFLLLFNTLGFYVVLSIKVYLPKTWKDWEEWPFWFEALHSYVPASEAAVSRSTVKRCFLPILEARTRPCNPRCGHESNSFGLSSA